jgi:hypothetical protein
MPKSALYLRGTDDRYSIESLDGDGKRLGITNYG